MNYQNAPTQPRATNVSYDYDHKVEESDARLQADPELAAAEGRAGPLLISAYIAAMLFVVFFVLYGLNHQRSETGQETSAAGAPTTSAPAPAEPAAGTGGAAPASQQQQANPQQNGANPPAKQQQAQPQQNGQQPEQNSAQPREQQNTPQNPAAAGQPQGQTQQNPPAAKQ